MMSAHLPGSSVPTRSVHAHEVGGVDGAGLNAGERRHAELVDVDVDLVGVEAVRVDGGIGAERYLYACLMALLVCSSSRRR